MYVKILIQLWLKNNLQESVICKVFCSSSTFAPSADVELTLKFTWDETVFERHIIKLKISQYETANISTISSQMYHGITMILKHGSVAVPQQSLNHNIVPFKSHVLQSKEHNSISIKNKV